MRGKHAQIKRDKGDRVATPLSPLSPHWLCDSSKSLPLSGLLSVRWEGPRSGILRLTLAGEACFMPHLLWESGVEADKAKPTGVCRGRARSSAPPTTICCHDPEHLKWLRAQASSSKEPSSQCKYDDSASPPTAQTAPALKGPPIALALGGGPQKGVHSSIHHLS